MRALLAAIGTIVVLGAGILPASPATADSDVEVTNDRGGDRADLTYRTALSVRGSGFQSVQGGFGGVYVLFGWVRNPTSDAWRPSRGGITGQDYQYIPDSEDSADNQGYLRFVAFPGSSTADEASTVLSRTGSFRVDLTVPGPVFQSVDRDGQVSEVDCRKVTCGVITVGAHGVKNARNETFTPVRFGSVYDTAPLSEGDDAAPDTSVRPRPTDAAPDLAPGSPEGADASVTTTTPGNGADRAPNRRGRTTRSSPPSVVTDRTTAIAGHALTFTGQGFTPGEQVLAVLDDGAAALGPLVAGASGEVVGVLPLPLDLTVGTHALRLSGAASGTEVSENFPVRAGSGPVTPAVAATSSEERRSDPGPLFLGVAGLAFLVALGAGLRRRRRSA